MCRSLLLEYIAIFIALYPILIGLGAFMWHNYYVKFKLKAEIDKWGDKEKAEITQQVINEMRASEFNFTGDEKQKNI